VAFGVFIIAFALTVWYINKPKTLEPYGKTVLAGKVNSKNPINNVVLLQAPAMDTVLIGAVKNNKFHIVGDKPIDPGIYYLRAGTYRTQVFFSSGDSLFIDLSLKETYNVDKISGTRIAENEFLRTGPRSDFYMLTDYAYTQKPNDYAYNAMTSWKEGVAAIEKFKTIDNIKPRADFVTAQKKLLALKINGLLQNYYPGVFSIYHPNETLKYPKSVDRIAKEAVIKDNSLAGFPQYRTYITETYRNKSGRNDSLYLSYLNAELQAGKAKNYVLFEVVQNDVFRIRDSVRRTQLLQQFLANITDDKLKNLLVQKNANLQSLQRGNKASNFLAESINNSDFDLAKLTNRFVVLDVWATWCQPCKKEAPFFEDLAERYTNEQLAFVSLSVDEDKNAWRMEASNKKGRVLQLWAKNAEDDFAKKYALATIPRFILIDWKGNIVNAEMPYPSDPEFEAILQKEIPFLRN
jgi:thiol-disulfide isomerase/thioredoxin